MAKPIKPLLFVLPPYEQIFEISNRTDFELLPILIQFHVADVLSMGFREVAEHWGFSQHKNWRRRVLIPTSSMEDYPALHFYPILSRDGFGGDFVDMNKCSLFNLASFIK